MRLEYRRHEHESGQMECSSVLDASGSLPLEALSLKPCTASLPPMTIYN